MHKHSSLALLELACSDSLLWLDLEVAPEISLQKHQPATAKLVSMKKLEGLKLAGLSMAPRTACIKNLRSLQALTLLRCKMTPLVLFMDNSLSLLRRLHMEDEIYEWATDPISRGTLNIGVWIIESILKKISKIILSLPYLQHISGESSFMEKGMKGLLVDAPSIKAYTSRSTGYPRRIKAVRIDLAKQQLMKQREGSMR